MRQLMVALSMSAVLFAAGCEGRATKDVGSGRSGPPSQSEIEAMKTAHISAAEAAKNGEPAAREKP